MIEREAVVGLGRGEMALALRDLAQVVESVLVHRVLAERLEVRGHGFVELARGVRLQAAVERFGGGPRGARGRRGARGGDEQQRGHERKKGAHWSVMVA